MGIHVTQFMDFVYMDVIIDFTVPSANIRVRLIVAVVRHNLIARNVTLLISAVTVHQCVKTASICNATNRAHV